MRFHPVLHYWRMHNVVDYGAPYGSRVNATADGQVSICRPGGDGGYHIQVTDTHGWKHDYYHCLPQGIQEGQEVHAGQQIGVVAHIGKETGPHCAYGLTDPHGHVVNPRLYYAKNIDCFGQLHHGHGHEGESFKAIREGLHKHFANHHGGGSGVEWHHHLQTQHMPYHHGGPKDWHHK